MSRPLLNGKSFDQSPLIVSKMVFLEKFQIFTKIQIFILFPFKTSLKTHKFPDDGKGKCHTAPIAHVP